MPPEEKLSAKEVDLLIKWIDQGAKWPKVADVADAKLLRAKKHWAFQPLAQIRVPKLEDDNWSKTNIDRFVLHKLREKGLKPSQPLDPARLCRRLFFDLIGLPPTVEQVQQFESAYNLNANAAIEKLVDDLLSQAGYGERWARHWLDVARYADSNGQEGDIDRPHAYRYRDFVIRSFNKDQPYDEFIRWQLAGDEILPNNSEAIVATGFLTAGTCTILQDTFLEEERLRNRYNELDDIISTMGNSMLGLSLGCARCHDHKYDAVPIKDYYSLLGIFQSGDRKDGKLPDGKPAYFFRDFDAKRRPAFVFKRGDFLDKGEEVSLGFVSALTRDTSPQEYWQAARKDVSGSQQIATTWQRKALANWITDTEKGPGELVARVMVNRIWQHHFGVGLVRTTSDFGVRGERPSHPELLEWLTNDFIQNGWKIKRLHKLILTSAVYQQGNQVDSQKLKVDPENRLLARMRPKRIEAEILRDFMLAVSGQLNRKAFGPGFKPFIQPEAIVARNLKEGGYPRNVKESQETLRRSVYMFHKRVVPYPLFQAFDRPDLLQSCGQRLDTTVAPQALAIMNDQFVRRRSEDFAKLLWKETKGDLDQLVTRCFQVCFSRLPTESESSSCKSFIVKQIQSRGGQLGKDGQSKKAVDEESTAAAVADFCQSIFGLNEFIYVD